MSVCIWENVNMKVYATEDKILEVHLSLRTKVTFTIKETLAPWGVYCLGKKISIT